ncbi:HlyD family type I secretion periplasmic adaptor subunit [uncultured Rhodoblastus sp.]|uniref:HlyD family type I secretion periplasmic adaptor subunit n=1 Tax=uncultured Rhodoblastus sp. TaxID=543037 RepID=UPI0025DCD492|nr:HlyD family type I secretion periplasmic adaptor subunit [uncultured Rhodoblastus sp.]
MHRETADLATVRRFQSEVAAIREAKEPYAIRMTIHVLAAGIVLVLAVILFAKVDRIVASSSGKVVATVKSSVFQALDDNSIIKSLDVREGDHVVKGQLLATLDPTFSGADVHQLADQIASLDAQIARAEGESQGHPPVFSIDGGAKEKSYDVLQARLYEQRAAQYQAQLNSFDRKIDQTLATIRKSEGDEARLKERGAIAGRVDEMRGKLLEKGAGSLLNKLTSEDASVEMRRQLENANNTAIEARQQLASLRADREAFIQNWSTQVSQEIVTARNSRDAAVAQLEKASKRQSLVQLKAPEDAIVLTVTKLSVGSVLRSGDQLITLAPLSAPVEADIQISPRDVGFIRVGDLVTLKIDAFNYAQYGVAEGEVKWISEGAFTQNDDTGQPVDPYYRVHVKITRTNFVHVPDTFRLIPGMTLTGDIKVGRRTVASYLWNAVANGREAMREP